MSSAEREVGRGYETNNLMLAKIINRSVIIIYSLAVLLVSTEKIDAPATFKYADLVAHFLFYLIYSVLFMRAIKPHRRSWIFYIYLTIGVSAGYGALMEFVQYFIPYRNASLLDATANLAGAIVGAVAYWYYKYHRGVIARSEATKQSPVCK